MSVTITPLSPEEVPHLIASVASLFVEDGGRYDAFMATEWPSEEGESYYRDLVRDEDALCLLARDEVVVGHLVGRIRRGNPLRPTARTAVLESMRVATGRRRAGVGTALVNAFTAWARHHSANELSVSAYAANPMAIAFYRARGFELFEVTSRHPLPVE
ncbi:GNAT family N-acetyltransferase [Streptomyces sp. ST2-7A]|uniref:GNAT family N-acetyltransferase n=1 Tax=Streptomyces sp. ST2-7A TaxID=2907214 RepID=UPI001F314C19|nr:GNAT family N-acetyltransferase [Streptomyces sp. ST2-7A]MCE7080633.1 GNAT family N-acetyltransferase [Streptomyces sp. ST2-7A]